MERDTEDGEGERWNREKKCGVTAEREKLSGAKVEKEKIEERYEKKGPYR